MARASGERLLGLYFLIGQEVYSKTDLALDPRAVMFTKCRDCVLRKRSDMGPIRLDWQLILNVSVKCHRKRVAKVYARIWASPFIGAL